MGIQPKLFDAAEKLRQRAFSVAAPQAWNRLPTELKLL